MLKLVIDRGNTRIKTALFKKGSLYKLEQFDTQDDLEIFINKNSDQITSGIVASTGIDLELNTSFPILKATNALNTPFQIAYHTPSTLGVDRIALATAAYNHYPGKNCLIIDMGTCITYDFIDMDGIYHGGAISPGLNMRFKSMQAFTNKLPLESLSDQKVSLTGKSTQESLQSGVFYGIFYEIEGIISAYQKKYSAINVIITGGDALHFADISKNGIFAPPEFLLEGLYYLLEYNAEKL